MHPARAVRVSWYVVELYVRSIVLYKYPGSCQVTWLEVLKLKKMLGLGRPGRLGSLPTCM